VLLRPHDAPPDRLTAWMERSLGWVFGPFNRGFRRAGDGYAARVGSLLGHRRYAIAGYVVMLVLAVVAFRAVPAGFIPVQDKQYLFAGALLPEGSSLDRTEAVARRMTDMARAVPGVLNVVAFPGLNPIQNSNTPNYLTMFVGLSPQGERDATAIEIATQLNIAFSDIQEGLGFALMPPALIGLGNSAGFEMYVQDPAVRASAR
jgi:multidrug efflux pump